MALASGDKQAALPHLVVATNKCPDLVRAHIEYQNLAKSLGGESEQAMVDFYMKMPERAPDDASPVPAYMRARLADLSLSATGSDSLSIEVTLPPGSYATVLLEELLGDFDDRPAPAVS
ncbi:MAG TPA: hypothetical protein EYP98_10450 [Planctomycetes bacterium]|nr:hypothetical protein [Planctomycetota bacterium]